MAYFESARPCALTTYSILVRTDCDTINYSPINALAESHVHYRKSHYFGITQSNVSSKIMEAALSVILSLYTRSQHPINWISVPIVYIHK